MLSLGPLLLQVQLVEILLAVLCDMALAAGSSLPSSRLNMVSILATSSGSTLIRRRVSGFMVVSHIMSGSFSPRPLERLMEHFWSPISAKMPFFSSSV